MSQKLLNKFHFYATTLLTYSESEKVLIKVQITVNHVSNDAIEKVTEHSDNTPCLMIFKLKVIFSMFPSRWCFCAWWRIYSNFRDSGRLTLDTYILLHWDSSFWLLPYSKNNSILLKAVFLLHQLWELCRRKLPCRLPSRLACS